MYEESAPEGALKNSAGGRVPNTNGTVTAFLDGEIQLMDLPRIARDLWSDGFRAGQNAAHTRVVRAEHAADIYYDLAFNGTAARDRHASLLKHFDVQQARKKAGAA